MILTMLAVRRSLSSTFFGQFDQHGHRTTCVSKSASPDFHHDQQSVWDHLNWLVDHRKEFVLQQEILRAAFSLCMHLKALRWAALLLADIDPTPQEVLLFASTIRRASQLLPLLISVKAFDNWQTCLSKAFAKLDEQSMAGLTSGQVFLLHEVLTGRCATLIRGSPESLQNLYREKFDDEASEISQREALEEKISPNIQAAGTVTPQRLGSFIPPNRDSQLGEPICVSVVDLGTDRFSLVVRYARHKWTRDTFSIPGFASDLQETLKWSEEWYLPGGVPWKGKTIDLVEKIGTYLRLPKHGMKWLMLSVSSEPTNSHLAQIPWQDLVFRYLDKNTVVSVVANFTWAKMEFRKPVHHSESVHRLGSESEYEETRIAILNGMAAIDSAAFVLGHGTWLEGKFTSVQVRDGPLEDADWENYATRRICVVHSCWGGRAEDCLLGDLGGLPFNGFALGCRFFCAPVCEVSSKTATVLHRYLTDISAQPELGVRYLNAIREDPAVALYTIYGFANEPARFTGGKDQTDCQQKCTHGAGLGSGGAGLIHLRK